MAGLTTNNQGFAQGWSPDTPGPGNASSRTNEYWTDTGAVRGPITEAESHTLAARSMSIIADPQPLGLAGFAAATFTLSTVIAGWHGFSAISVAAPVAIFFGGIAQFLAGMWAFRRGSTLAATAFGTFGAFNVAFGVLLILMNTKAIPMAVGGTNTGYVAGWFIITFGVIAGYLAIAALAENWVLVAILATLSATYIFDGLGTMIVGPNNWATYIGGYCGIVSSLLAFYLSAALVINASFKREVVPLFATHGPNATMTNPSTGVLGDQMVRR